MGTDACNARVIEALLQQPGEGGGAAGQRSRLTMLPAAALGLPTCGASVAFADVAAAARRRRCTALGYRRLRGRLLLATPASAAVTFEEGDQVVVLS